MSATETFARLMNRLLWSPESRYPFILSEVRFIDVYSRRLVSSEKPIEYTILTYVWGRAKQQTRSPHDNDRDLLGSNLPQTVEDAIKVTAKLGYRYLWVDSVCIDQTKDEEKRRLCRMMDIIYSRAIVCLVAVSGQDANSGLPGICPGSRTFQNAKRFHGITIGHS